MVTKISWDQANSLRLKRHHLTGKARKEEIARTVADVCGIQAQVLSAAELAIRARVEDIVQEDVKDALWKSHSLVKTWCMRGTLHLLASADLPLYVAALRSKLEDSERWLQEVQGVSTGEVALITEGIREALSERSLTREQLSREVELRKKLKTRTKENLRSAWGILLRPAAYQGHLAFGESIGPKVVFVDPSRWIIPRKEPKMKVAILELFKRFVKAYGPVSMNDFGHWWGGLEDDNKSSLLNLSKDFARVEVDGFSGLMFKRDAEEAAGLEPTRSVHLLPSFDCYPMFYAPRELFVPKANRSRIFRQTAGWNYPSLVVDGRAAGIWSLKKHRRTAEIVVEAFRSLGARERKGIQEEGASIARFLGTSVDIRYQPAVHRANLP